MKASFFQRPGGFFFYYLLPILLKKSEWIALIKSYHKYREEVEPVGDEASATL